MNKFLEVYKAFFTDLTEDMTHSLKVFEGVCYKIKEFTPIGMLFYSLWIILCFTYTLWCAIFYIMSMVLGAFTLPIMLPIMYGIVMCRIGFIKYFKK